MSEILLKTPWNVFSKTPEVSDYPIIIYNMNTDTLKVQEEILTPFHIEPLKELGIYWKSLSLKK